MCLRAGLIAASAAVCAAAIAVPGIASSRPPGPVPSVTTQMATPGVPACRSSQLVAAYTVVFGSNATGHVQYELTIIDRSSAGPCALTGPLKLTLLGKTGRRLPTHPMQTRHRYQVILVRGQWAESATVISPDLTTPGERTRGNCEPVAHAIAIAVGAGTVRAPMDPTPVCGFGAISFPRLHTVPVTPPCSPGSLSASFRRQLPPFGGFATYNLVLRDTLPTPCHVDNLVGVQLLGAGGAGLTTHVSAGVLAPYVLPARKAQTALARLAVRGGSCDPVANEISITPGLDQGGLTTAVSPPVRVCRGGLVELSSLFQNG